MEEAEQGERHRMVAVMGAKGGCGATLLAASLAAEQSVERSVCVVDLDFGKGDLAGCLDLWPTRTLLELLSDTQRLDADVIRGTAVPHKGGFSVLAQPHDLSRVLLPSAEEIKPILSYAREIWSLLVVDCGSRADETALATALAADLILLVTTPHVSSLRDAGRKMELLQKLDVPSSKLRLLVNMRSKKGVTTDAIAEQLGIAVTAEIPLDPEAAHAVDYSGRLVREQVPNSLLGRSFSELWSRIDGTTTLEAAPWWRPW